MADEVLSPISRNTSTQRRRDEQRSDQNRREGEEFGLRTVDSSRVSKSPRTKTKFDHSSFAYSNAIPKFLQYSNFLSRVPKVQYSFPQTKIVHVEQAFRVLLGKQSKQTLNFKKTNNNCPINSTPTRSDYRNDRFIAGYPSLCWSTQTHCN